MKRLLGMLMVLCLLVFAVGGACAEGEVQDIKIGICLSDHTHTTFIAMLDAARAYAKENGHINLIEQDGKSAVESMCAAMENFINADCDAIIVQNAYPDVLGAYIEEAVDAGIVVYAYDSVDENANYSYIADNEVIGLAIGRMAGEWINKTVDGKGKVALLAIDRISFLKDRADFIIKGLLEVAPESEIVVRQETIDIGDGYDKAEILSQSNPEINCYVSVVDSAVCGACNAYMDVGFHGVCGFFGSDATEEAVNMLADPDGFFEGTLHFELDKMMVDMVKSAFQHCNGMENVLTDKVSVLVPVVVNRENYKDYLK